MGLALRHVLPLKWQQEWQATAGAPYLAWTAFWGELPRGCCDAACHPPNLTVRCRSTLTRWHAACLPAFSDSNSEQLLSELLKEEEREHEKVQRRQQKAAKKKASKKGGAGSRGAATASAISSSYLEGAASHSSVNAAAALSSSASPTGAAAEDQLPDSWEQLPEPAAAAAVAMREAGSSVDVPPGYLRMLQEYEVMEEQRLREQAEQQQHEQEHRRQEQKAQRQKEQERRRQEQWEQQQGAAAAAGAQATGNAPMQPSKRKKNGRKGKNKEGAAANTASEEPGGKHAIGLAPSGTAPAEDDTVGWQAVGNRKGPVRRLQQAGPALQALPQPPSGRSRRQEQADAEQRPGAAQDQPHHPQSKVHQRPQTQQGHQLLAEAAPFVPAAVLTVPRQQRQQQHQHEQDEHPLRLPDELDLTEPLQSVSANAPPLSPSSSFSSISQPRQQLSQQQAPAPAQTLRPASSEAFEDKLMYQMLGIGSTGTAAEGSGRGLLAQEQQSATLAPQAGPPMHHSDAPGMPAATLAMPMLPHHLHRAALGEGAAAVLHHDGPAAQLSQQLGLSGRASSLFSEPPTARMPIQWLPQHERQRLLATPATRLLHCPCRWKRSCTPSPCRCSRWHPRIT